jgi:kynurenine formamidase
MAGVLASGILRHRAYILLVLSLIVAGVGLVAQAPASRIATRSDVDKWMTELSNWGRWGKDDEKGTVNLITPARRKAAAALVTEGFSVSLSRDTDSTAAPDNGTPFVHKMSEPAGGAFNMDEFGIFFHGWAYTHFDALSHVFYKDTMYNGFPASSVTKAGAGKLAVTAYRDGIAGRGVIVDIARLKGVPYLDGPTAVYPEDLDAWEKSTGVRIGAGDLVFVRTGRWARRAAKGPWDPGAESAGLHASSARWLKARDVAVFGSDTSGDVRPSGVDGVDFPVHQLLLVAMGTPMFDQCDLEAVASAAAARKRWTFFVTAAPIRAVGGTGGPVNIVAIF